MRSIAGLAGAYLILLASLARAADPGLNDGKTTTPIKHVIVVIAENRSFDNVFGTYRPQPGQTVFNLLSEGIVNEDGTPGPNFAKAAQFRAQVISHYEIAPEDKEPYATLPPAMTDGAPSAPSDRRGPPFATLKRAMREDSGILRRGR